MFINAKIEVKEKEAKYCVTIHYAPNKRTKEQLPPLKIYFNSEKEADNITYWFSDRDTDCLSLEYDLDPVTEQFQERIMLERKSILKITKEST